MDKNLDLIAKEMFGKIRTQFPKIQLGDANSKVTDRPEDARFFEFDYVKNDQNLGTISVSLSEDDGVVILYSNDIVDDQPTLVKKQWFRFLRGMRDFAKARLLNFSIRDIAKTNLDKRDYKFLSNNSGEAAMTESKLWGTSKTSFQAMGEAKLIVKHSKPVNYDLPAGRTMHIESIFIENAEGERFRYPYKHLNGARALATHVAHGGNSYDDIGQHIIGLSEELNKLRMFKGYVDRHPVIAEAMDSINGRVFERIDQIKKEISGLQRPAYYQAFAENFTKREEVLIPEDVVNDWVDRLTIRNFNEELKNVFPYIYNLVGENVAPVVELTPEDLTAAQDQTNGIELETELSELSDFESYLDQLVKEDNEIFNTDGTESMAIDKLNQLMSNEVPAGTDGTNAIQSIKGIIDDDDLNDALKSLGKIDPEGDVRDTIKKYLDAKDKENGTDISSKVNYSEEGNTQAPENETPPTAEPAAEAPPAEAPAAAAPAAAPAPEAQPAPVAEDNDPPFDGPYKKSGDHKDQFGNTIKTKNMAKHLAKQGMAKAIEKAKKAGATAETIVNFGSGEMSLGEAIVKAGLNIEDYFAEAVANKKAQEVVEFIKSMFDETTGKFPKGETGVLISVEKEFGEDAKNIAAHVISELSTIYEANDLRRLSGLPLLEFGISDIAQGIGKGVGAVKGAWQGAKDSFAQGMAQGQAAGQAATGPQGGPNTPATAQPNPKVPQTPAAPQPKTQAASPKPQAAPTGKTSPASPAPTTTTPAPAPNAPAAAPADEYAPRRSGAWQAAVQQYDTPQANPTAAPADISRMKQLAGVPGGTTTTTNTSVSGTMKMGKPDGPITFNGKTVNPGDPQYATASQALIQQQQKMQQSRSAQMAPRNPGTGGTISQGASLGDRDW